MKYQEMPFKIPIEKSTYSSDSAYVVRAIEDWHREAIKNKWIKA